MRFAAFSALVLMLPSSVSAQTSTVAAVVGSVRYDGVPPARATITPHVNKNICGARDPMVREDLLVGSGGGLKNVAILLDGDGLTGRTTKIAKLDQKNCTFVPHVQTLTAGSTLEIGNDDRVIHNVHAMSKGRTVFNLAMPRRGVRLRRKLPTPGVVSMMCDSGHTWMSAHVVVVPHDYHAVTDATGRFAIRGVPAGSYKVRAWHEVLGLLEGEVTVGEGQVSRVELTYRPAAEISPGKAAADRAEVTSKLQELESSLAAELEETKAALAATQELLALEKKRALEAKARPLYLQHCATCHGARGNGKGPSAQYLATMPRDFTRGEYKFRMTPSGAPPRVIDIYRTISLGVVGTEMPPWRETLTKSQRRMLAEYVLTFAEFDEEDREDPISIEKEPPKPTEETIARGKVLYGELQCGQCHGPEGRGDGPSVATMKDAWGNPIRPADLTKAYFKGGRGTRVVYRTIVTGLSGSPMPSFGDLLEEEDRWALAHYVLSLSEGRGFFEYLFLDGAGRLTTP